MWSIDFTILPKKVRVQRLKIAKIGGQRGQRILQFGGIMIESMSG